MRLITSSRSLAHWTLVWMLVSLGNAIPAIRPIIAITTRISSRVYPGFGMLERKISDILVKSLSPGFGIGSERI